VLARRVLLPHGVYGPFPEPIGPGTVVGSVNAQRLLVREAEGGLAPKGFTVGGHLVAEDLIDSWLQTIAPQPFVRDVVREHAVSDDVVDDQRLVETAL